ncbi:sodium-dependent nutrient amino acid transporter 1, partial [Trichonephila clavata]
LRNFCKDVEFMLNKSPGIFWKFTWSFTAPVALMVIFVFGIIDAESKADPSASQWASNVGWILAAFALIQIPLWFIVEVYRNPHCGIVKKFLNALKPAENWGPRNPLHFNEWKNQKDSRLSTKIPKNSISTIGSAYANDGYKEDVF